MNSFNNEQVLITSILFFFLQLIVHRQTEVKTSKQNLKTQKNLIDLISTNESHLFHPLIFITASIPMKNNSKIFVVFAS